MKAHTSTFKNNIKKLGRELDSQITYTLNNEEIVLGKEQLNAITPHYEGDILKSVMKQLDIDSNVDIPIGTEVNYQFGVKVNNNYEYLDYGNYIVYSSEKQEDTRSYKIVCYDKMLYAMKNYERIESKNLANINVITNLSNPNLTRTIINDTIVLSGNTNTSGYATMERKLRQICPNLQVGDVATLTFNTTYTTKYIYLAGTGANMTWNTGTTKTITQAMLDSTVICYGGYNTTTTISNFQIEKGSQATNYVPHFEYPTTLKTYLWNLCDKIDLDFNNTNFVNYDKEIPNELYLDSEGNSLDYTYRDVLDEIAGATASTICINEDDELEVRYVKEYKLPNGYSELDYLENTNYEYIDTGIIPTTNTKIDIDFMYLDKTLTGWNPVFGERGSTSATYYGLFVNSSSLYITPNYAGFDPGTGTGVIIETNKKYNLKNDKGQFYLDDELKTGMSTTSHTLTTGDRSVYLFTMNVQGSSRRGLKARIYRCKFYEENTLIRDFIPTLRLSDNTIGMYDIVNNVFYTNQGAGNFTYGSIVNESIDLIDEEYLKDINVNFGEKYGPVNSIVFSRSAESDNIYRQDEDSIEEYGLHEIKIKDNQILNGNNRDTFIDGVFNQLNGFEYYANDYSSTGIAYYDLCDRYNVKVDDNIYSCIMMNDELDITQGLEEKVHLDIPEKSETDYKKAEKTDRRFKETWIIANKQEGYIQALTSRTATLEENTYTITQVNDLIQNAESGITNTFSEAGGNNIFRNTGLWFENSGTDSQQNPYEFWTGVVVRAKEEKASNMNALLLQNGNLIQEQLVPNGNYTIGFRYKKILSLANAKVYINEVEYTLNEIDDTEFLQVIQVVNQHINIKFTCDIDNGCEIYDLMVNAGSVKLAYSQNQNETTTDTVNISKGITITSSDLDVTFKANADGIRTLDRSGNEITKFTDIGMTTEEAIIKSKSTIVGTLWQEVNGQTWITRL